MANARFSQIFESKGDTMTLLCLLRAWNVRWEIGLSIAGQFKVSLTRVSLGLMSRIVCCGAPLLLLAALLLKCSFELRVAAR